MVLQYVLISDSGKDGSFRGGRGSKPGRSRGRGQGRGSSQNPPFSQGRGPEKPPYVEGPGRAGRGQRGRGSDDKHGRPRGRGGEFSCSFAIRKIRQICLA